MARVTVTKQRGIADAVRWFARTLLVVAGAAIAWAIGSATADATVAAPDTQPAPSAEQLTPVTDAAVHGVNDVTWGVSNLAGDTSGAAVHAWNRAAHGKEDAAQDRAGDTEGKPQHRKHRVLDPGFADGQANDRFAGEVSGAIHDFAENAVLTPVQNTLGSLEHVVRRPADAPQVIDRTIAQPTQDFGKKVWDLFHPGGKDLIQLPVLSGDPDNQPAAPGAQQPVGVAPAAPVVTGVPGAAVAGDSFGAAWASDTSGHEGTHAKPGSTGHRHHDVPLAPVRVPMAPLTAPTVPGGANAGGHVDGQHFGLPNSLTLGGFHTETGLVRFGYHHVTIEPGAQPGVTPD